jgi:ligand-binding sensor domain-containing protein
MQPQGDPFVSVSFSPQNTGVAFAITKSGALFTTSLGVPLPTVVNWTRQNGWVGRNNGDGVRHMAIHPNNDNRVYAITENTLAKTSNRGGTWTTILRNIPTQKYYSIAATKQDLFLGTSDGVFKTANEGTTWKKKNGNLPNVKVVQLVIDGNYLYAVSFGRGLWRIPLSQL